CEKKIIREKDVCQAIPELSGQFTSRTVATFLGKTGHALISQEKKRFQKALLDSGGDREQAAKLLNISRATYFRRAKELGLVEQRKRIKEIYF
ncbi:MAG TPA: helix-turn-helix domain-containing protein, partial [Rhabdochlamydiaceae bacterium]|nr:helix-turn-helix domain-containing protein [Rhabdochlamydiaceae bacterium]